MLKFHQTGVAPMPMRSIGDMMEATRLTRQGRLEEAMAILRGAHPGGNTAMRDHDRDADHPEADAHASTVVDLVPPSSETGTAWTVPPSEKNASAPGRSNIRPAPRFGALLGGTQNITPHIPDGRFGQAARPAHAPLPKGATFGSHRFVDVAGSSRSYKLYVPSGYTGQALPLVVMLHGCTQSPDDFAIGTRMNELAEERVFLVAYPAQDQSANPSKCWNWFSENDQRRDHGEPSLIAGITRQIMREYLVETRRIYVAGLSAGGAAAAIMGAAYPDLYAAIGVHSGLMCGAARDMPSAFAAMRNGARPAGMTRSQSKTIVPTIVFHGDGDTTVNPINGDQIIAQTTLPEFSATISRGKASGGMSYTRAVHTDETGRPMLEQWVLHGAGHAWSGGNPAGSYTDPRGPDASREMVRFFLDRGGS